MLPPILANKVHDAPSVFTAENMLREAVLAEGFIPLKRKANYTRIGQSA